MENCRMNKNYMGVYPKKSCGFSIAIRSFPAGEIMGIKKQSVRLKELMGILLQKHGFRPEWW